MNATDLIKDVFENRETNVLNIADLDLDDGFASITHVVLDGNKLQLYSGNPDLEDDFQDDDYEPILLDDDDDKWMEIKSAIANM